ncbi:PREDICTED: uncharacterized protein LOC105154986 [Acromyrmex echinatior]|uniref:Uncharacterized protein n=1 Tax=Acromyrmex echinatior TaxID=103372 RepID=F4WA13_ACREC|nr:PREDICTED: uncharacterized protein LOC105154986 [Acromyrmex echinatior]XP_011069132.1 PREDICTED: uncharacterized protein LOC105154986 [Acromyrmex echinatior]EGI68943.1 hypothetical protein G5I_02327 [Acromyrmex echinatior]
MAFQLDDLLKDDKKDANLIPDLSKATCNSYEEFRRLKENCPEFKIKPEKVKREDTKVRDKEFSCKATKKELKNIGREWAYGDPVPPDMRGLDLQELQQVAIDWRMLTPIRPKLRQDEEMFSKLVEMGKLEAKTIAKERRSPTSPIRRSKNRAGIIESSVKTCKECGEEYCFGEFCGDVLYDSFTRVTITTQQSKIKISANAEAIIANMDRKKRKRKKGRKRVKSKNRTSKKSARLLVNNKTRRSITESESKIVKARNNGEQGEKPVKQFKRKCSKYTKKGHLRK